ncbi:phosphatase PAP2 family protein [Eggerthella sinensis]|uniref:phosphatase PAP2 family protein n=1 Tax=Eggerthella sinensis TaxID=242230 RepID=UPI002FD7ECFA
MDTPMTFAAGWLNDVFAPFDLAVLGALHALAEGAGFALTPLFEAVSFVGEKGACFFALALVLMLFKRTRKAGVCVFVALCLGALASNVVLKDLVARPRPFESSALYLDWWRFAGAAPEDGFSFPSGHMTAASAATVASCWSFAARRPCSAARSSQPEGRARRHARHRGHGYRALLPRGALSLRRARRPPRRLRRSRRSLPPRRRRVAPARFSTPPRARCTSKGRPCGPGTGRGRRC